MSKVKVEQKSPVIRRLDMENVLDTPFQKARSKFVIGSPVMHHSSPSVQSPFFGRINYDDETSSTPGIKEEIKEEDDDDEKYPTAKETSPVVRWVMQQSHSWSTSNNNSEDNTNQPKASELRHSNSSYESEKCYSLTYEEEMAVTIDFDDEDMDDSDVEKVGTQEVQTPTKEKTQNERREIGTYSISQLRKISKKFEDEISRPSKCRLMTWYDPAMATMLKRLVQAVSLGYQSRQQPPCVVHPLEMIQFKVHPPRYTTDLTPVIASRGSSPDLLAEMVARVTRQPHSHVKLTLPNGEKLQVITQDGWSEDIDKTVHLGHVHALRKPENSIKEDKWTTTEYHVCTQCHLLREELQKQNDDFRRQISDTERELDAIRQTLTGESKHIEALETTLHEERERHAELRMQFDKMEKAMRDRPLWSSTPKEIRKRPGCASLLIFDKSKVAKKSKPNMPLTTIKKFEQERLSRSASFNCASCRKSNNEETFEHMKHHPDANVRELYQALQKAEAEKEHLQNSLRETNSQVANSKDNQQRALENELIQLRETNKLLTESYQAEKIARKRFFSMLEDAKGKIRVYCRIRPLLPNESSCILDCIDDYTVALNGIRGRQEFQFDHVFTSKHTQEDVFAIAKDMIGLAYEGYNVCIFGYGQTGSGKTYTLLGDPQGKDPGIASRAFLKLFELISENESTQDTTVQISAMELYNEKLLDLLHLQGVPDEKLEIRKEANGMVSVLGCKSKEVDRPSSLLEVFYEACAKRHVASTKMNSRSSRSHLIITLLVESTNRLSGTVARGKFSLVDLAGSERQSKSNTVSAQLKEANSINKSLSALGDVIAALASEQPHVPYRNNKLTQLMQDSLGGNAKTLMFVNVSPAQFNLEETTSSLHYAARVKQIKNDPSRMTESKEIARLKSIIAQLRKGVSVSEA